VAIRWMCSSLRPARRWASGLLMNRLYLLQLRGVLDERLLQLLAHLGDVAEPDLGRCQLAGGLVERSFLAGARCGRGPAREGDGRPHPCPGRAAPASGAGMRARSNSIVGIDHREHLPHTGCAGGSDAIGSSVVDGQAALRPDVEALGSREVQVRGRFPARGVFTRDDGCEVLPQSGASSPGSMRRRRPTPRRSPARRPLRRSETTHPMAVMLCGWPTASPTTTTGGTTTKPGTRGDLDECRPPTGSDALTGRPAPPSP
jgi:hypothetical protein